MKILKPRNLYLPAVIIVAVILLLLIFIGFSTYWNLDRARTNALRFVHQQGSTIIAVLESSVLIMQDMPDKNRIMARLIDNTAKSEAITYAYIADDRESVLYHSPDYEQSPFGIWNPASLSGDLVESRIRYYTDSRRPMTYEVARKIPLAAVSDEASATITVNRNAILVVGMEMQTFEAAMREDIHHAVVMVSILAALALGSAFFIFVINRYHRINRNLKENQEYTRQVVESMANGLLSIDPQGRVISANAQGLYLLGVRPEDGDEINLNRFIDFNAGGISETLTRGTTVMDKEMEIRHESGELLPVAASVTPILSNSGNREGAVVILRDLREIKQLEEKIRQSEQLAALGRMSAAVAHEIRNPLSSIRGFAQFLGHVLKDREKEHEYAMIMVREVDRMNRVVTDLLNFARPLEIEAVPTDPYELLSHTLRLVNADATERGIDIRLQGKKCNKPVMIDPGLMTQVLLNILLNAVQSVETQGRVDLRVKKPIAGQVVFEIDDNGPGIPETEREQIFEPFFTTRETGTGLGLSIVRKIVETHGGDVQVTSPVPGKTKGCRFTVSLPST